MSSKQDNEPTTVQRGFFVWLAIGLILTARRFGSFECYVSSPGMEEALKLKKLKIIDVWKRAVPPLPQDPFNPAMITVRLLYPYSIELWKRFRASLDVPDADYDATRRALWLVTLSCQIGLEKGINHALLDNSTKNGDDNDLITSQQVEDAILPIIKDWEYWSGYYTHNNEKEYAVEFAKKVFELCCNGQYFPGYCEAQ